MTWVKTDKEDLFLKEGENFPKGYTKEKEKSYFYLAFIEDKENKIKWLKCGITCNPKRRMIEHTRKYSNIKLVWVSPLYSTYTAIRVENNFKKYVLKELKWKYQRNDRFILPDNVKSVKVKVRKTYEVMLE